MNFEFATANRIIFGAGVLREAGKLAERFGRKALVVTGSTPDRARPLVELLSKQGIEVVVFPIPKEPEIAVIEKGTALAKEERCEMVIGFGGGSALDGGKALAAMAANPGELLDYVEIIGRGKALPNEPLPYIAIPTTAGTGSEVTRNAVLASPEHRVKVSLRSQSMLPKIALVDPELTYGLPPSITASTGLDALTQLIEPYVCARANPMTDALCAEGIRRAARSLRTAVDNGRDAMAREDMCVASVFGGLALANAGLGAAHGFAGPIGGMFPAPHGAVCAALLPHVMAVNLRAVRLKLGGGPVVERYGDVARWLMGRGDETAEDGVHWVRQLVADLKIPGLRTYGIKEADRDALVAKARQASSMKANPVVLSDEELGEILEAAL